MRETLTCVLIDDDSDWVELIHRCLMLTRATIEAVKFVDPVAALGYLRRNNVDLVVTDLRMPGMDGMKLVDELRSFDRETPVIMASSEESAADQARAVGVTAFVRKGALNVHLVETVRRLFPASAARAPAPLR